MATPSSQKQGVRNVGFMLWNTQSGIEAEHNLVIRPEELSKQDPSRINIAQTLGGAWADSFGPGISQITLSGHTGWRGTAERDGLDLFADLYKSSFTQWHDLRNERIDRGRDPDEIQLIFTDFLDDVAVVVAPISFTLKRHKAKPLLAQFAITLSVLGPVSDEVRKLREDAVTEAIVSPKGRFQAAKDALPAIVEAQRNIAKQAAAIFGPLTTTTAKVLEFSADALEFVQGLADTKAAIFDAVTAPALQAVADIERASRNAFQILVSGANFGAQIHNLIQSAASSLHNAYCTLVSGFLIGTTIPDFSTLFGASTCSSTAGGRPVSIYAGKNPWLFVFNVNDPASPARTASISVTGTAAAAITELKKDPLASAATETQVITWLKDLMAGVKIGS